MFGMGFSEIMIILVIGIIFLGPDKLPEAMVKIAKFFNTFKKTINEAKESIDQELKIEELKKEALEYKKKLHETTNSVKHSVYMDEFEEIKNSATDINKTFKKSVEEAAVATKDDVEIEKTEKKIKKKKKSSPKKIEDTPNKEDLSQTEDTSNV
jgi:sec-independent protein translocase protein TatB